MSERIEVGKSKYWLDISSQLNNRLVSESMKTDLSRKEVLAELIKNGFEDKDILIQEEKTNKPINDGALPKMFWCWSEHSYPFYLDNEYIMHSAGADWENGEPQWDSAVPNAKELMVDSGGFQVEWKWGGEYPYTSKEYLDQAEKWGVDYAFGMDYACEKSDNTTGRPISERVENTIEDHLDNFEVYENENYSFDFLPVLQGYEPEDYVYTFQQMKDYGLPMDYVGVGSVCKVRNVDIVVEVLDAINSNFDTKIHLFGADLRVWKDERTWNNFYSADTAAWKRNVLIKGENINPEHHEKPFAYNQYKRKVVEIQRKINHQKE